MSDFASTVKAIQDVLRSSGLSDTDQVLALASVLTQMANWMKFEGKP